MTTDDQAIQRFVSDVLGDVKPSPELRVAAQVLVRELVAEIREAVRYEHEEGEQR